MDKELIVKGIHDPVIARRIFRAIEGDPGELRQVLSKNDVGWRQNFDFVVFEDSSRNLHTVAWFPSPSPAKCIIVATAAAGYHMQQTYGEWPAWLRSSVVTIIEDALTDEPITRAQLCCDGTNITLDVGDEVIMWAEKAEEIIKERGEK